MIAAGVRAYSEEYLTETERFLANKLPREDFTSTFKRTVGLKGAKARSEQVIRDEHGALLRDKVRIRERWSGFYHKLSNTKSLKLDPTIIGLSPPRPLELLVVSLGDEPAIDEMTEAHEGAPNWNILGPDGLPAELLKIDHPTCAQCFPNILGQRLGNRRSPQQYKYAIIKALQKSGNDLIATTTEEIRLLPPQVECC